MCDCECKGHKSCDKGEYLHYKNCKCRNKLVDKLVEECIEIIDGNKMLHNETLDMIPLNDYKKVCNSCTIYTICCIFHNKHMHWQWFYLCSLLFKKT